MKIKTVTVLGANGTMGCNVSGIFASFGNSKVYMVSRSIDASKKAAEKAIKSVKADSIAKNLIPADYSMLEECIRESDLVFESVAEDFEIKRNTTAKIVEYIDEKTICCSGTSGLSLTKLAEQLPENLRKNYMGVHMYNPPYSMTLCELVPTQYTDRALFNKIRDYLSNVLFRTTVEVKDMPAFLGNRIGFNFINEALQFADKYKFNGGIDYIDSILGQFTGRSMAPLATSDFVGLDVHKAITDNIYQNTCDYAHNAFVMPDFAVNLVKEGKLGRKTKGGLYKLEKYNDSLKRYLVYDIVSGNYRDKMDFKFPFSEYMISALKVGDYKAAFEALINNHSVEAEICLEFMLKYVLYALYAADNVGYNIHAADDVMAAGFNWCPPLAVIRALFGVEYFTGLVKERISAHILEKIDLQKILVKIEPSEYDYRRYFKAMK